MKTSFDERQAQNTVFRRMTFTPSGERKLALNEQLEIPLLVRHFSDKVSIGYLYFLRSNGKLVSNLTLDVR